MSRSKRPRRPYNRNRALLKGTQNLVLEHRETWGKDVKVEFDSGATGQIFKGIANPDICRAAVKTRRRWYLVIKAFCIDSAGQSYISEVPMATEPCALDDLKDHYIEQRDKLEDSINPKHLIQMGWTARPLTKQLEQRLEQHP